MHEKSLFPDEEPASLPRRPQPERPMTKKGKMRLFGVSLGLAALIHGTIKEHLRETGQRSIHSMREVAEETGKPLVIKETSHDIGRQVVQVLSGEKPTKETQTTVINPPGQEPPIKVVTPTETIIANEDGEPTAIIPHDETAEASTLREAQSTVNEALKDAAEKTLPAEDKPLIPPALKEN